MLLHVGSDQGSPLWRRDLGRFEVNPPPSQPQVALADRT